MKPIQECALRLLQSTLALVDAAKAGELSSIDSIQQQRQHLIAELDLLSHQPDDEETLLQIRRIIEQSRELENQASSLLQQQRDEANRTLSKLKVSKKARKAYGEF
ncbi:flagellar protein FliT [Marinobacterium stanieri]|uniref:Flagellar protein FliT n=1 Tax=Marinobacterium stanieri TaxID=49186 RepID=A0A1N6X2I2_9GAMM|nr:flagellar protein FliT [Marinobacterium stanieri]SIQ96489.1 protein FliT [Marinobacterium stanieri]